MKTARQIRTEQIADILCEWYLDKIVFTNSSDFREPDYDDCLWIAEWIIDDIWRQSILECIDDYLEKNEYFESNNS